MSGSGSKIPSNHDVRPHEDEDFYRLTFYEALGISEGATAEDIKRAYKKGILEHHPDKNTSLDVEVATRRFRRIQEAYEQRRQYDIQRNPQRHRYTSRPSSAANTTQTFTHHHYHFRPPATSSTPKQSFSFTFSSSAQASFSFGLSSASASSSATATTTAHHRDDNNSEVLWSFTTRGHGNGRQPPSATTQGDDGARNYGNVRVHLSESVSSSEEEDESDSVSSSD
ncbi:hypothetical protein AGABI1DRAFT_132885 [Agaricus bisporus var. burnettii JB137-S8]|uniref:J domain-containing protein n=1 Tax=Agaricus bisporus var. burnettii (strain JB137-S8 / ATCC MYA-4627 / FGSC 10392) TaxID=597362 RepID=K5WHL8_AGABU|nr:uncharacterized protein AGABI1DRAFT_132885 [Agaricus bisporus var. burnettii JB137-S8]EKM74766.1 hypothetical protein AGABI1DRAFT_132885 [Agaricus bisporus var. burnettii JB137-S8]